MAEQLSTFATSCSGGLINNQDPLSHGGQFAGSAYRLITMNPPFKVGIDVLVVMQGLMVNLQVTQPIVSLF
jgi:hypothetical protein